MTYECPTQCTCLICRLEKGDRVALEEYVDRCTYSWPGMGKGRRKGREKK